MGVSTMFSPSGPEQWLKLTAEIEPLRSRTTLRRLELPLKIADVHVNVFPVGVP